MSYVKSAFVEPAVDIIEYAARESGYDFDFLYDMLWEAWEDGEDLIEAAESIALIAYERDF